MKRPCLLYTSDAADERSSVDLGGRRIIKKKKEIVHVRRWESNQKQMRVCTNKNSNKHRRSDYEWGDDSG